jgi:hypothetical protein
MICCIKPGLIEALYVLYILAFIVRCSSVKTERYFDLINFSVACMALVFVSP